MESKVIEKAMNFAYERHKGKCRRSRFFPPYIMHPIRVYSLLRHYGQATDEELLAAGLLHDVIEDCGVMSDELKLEFGDKVARIVSEVSDDKEISKGERKALQVQNAENLSAEAALIRLADKIANVEDIYLDPPVNWDIARRVKYLLWAQSVAENCPRVETDETLREKLFQLIDEALASLNKEGESKA